MEQNDLDGARSLIAGAQAKFPANGGLENLLGVIEVQQGHTDRAIQEFSAAISARPKPRRRLSEPWPDLYANGRER